MALDNLLKKNKDQGQSLTPMLYLDYVGQYFLQSLVPAVAQEAVCVQRVVVAVETKLHQVVLVLHLLRSGECDLGGGPAEVQRSHGGFARTQPVTHKAILPENHKTTIITG